MKKTILFLILAFVSGFNSTFGQSFSLVNSANLTVNDGDTIVLSTNVIFSNLNDGLQLFNNSGVAKSVMAEKLNMTVINGADAQFSFGLFCCLIPGTLVTPGPTVIDPALSTIFNCNYYDNGFPGTSYVDFSFYDEFNPTDRISVTYKFEVTQATGIKQNTSVADYSVYPNPSNGIFILTLSTDKNTFSTQVYNSTGQVVLEIRNTEITDQLVIDLSNQPDGIYTVRYIGLNNGSTKVLNLIKN